MNGQMLTYLNSPADLPLCTPSSLGMGIHPVPLPCSAPLLGDPPPRCRKTLLFLFQRDLSGLEPLPHSRALYPVETGHRVNVLVCEELDAQLSTAEPMRVMVRSCWEEFRIW